MKSLIFVLSVLSVMGLAFWAYSENYRTQAALKDVARLQREIGQLRETRAILKAEWAYLNRPARLRDLTLLNFDRLELVPILPTQFGRVEQIAYPKPPEITDALDVVGLIPEELLP